MVSSPHLLSFIVPFYNNENFVVASLSSLFNQIADDIEVIIIDDGSTDTSAERVRQLLAERQHPHVTFISQKNGGIAYARNVGLRHARGRFITFLDGDDLLSNDYLAILRPLLVADEDDLIDFNYQKFTDVPPTQPADTTARRNTYDFASLGLSCLTPLFAHSMWHLWSRIYRRSLLEGESFENGRRYEDVIFTPFQYFKTQKIAHLDHVLYFYRDNSQGITRNVKAKDIEDMQFAIDKMLLFIDQHPGDESLRQLAALMLANCFSEVKGMSKVLYGYYYYPPEARYRFRRLADVCSNSGVPRKKVRQMRYAWVDTWLSKIRWRLKKR
ncbi:Chondroitin polymerase [Serratia proteamaculans]|uniref:Glycosyltransferase n=1 Tax=Serratia proteamaculans TaxID=28151 RepID=A0ABS0TXH6_SERPR|nr:glycosyltransferase [Serratia proteamaculans]KAB1493286.1 glycosyltransferase [Serratia proteamaculans]MBI6183077.1 glycosyltransferase [Serratia proteamaculans]RYM49487.1 glycosyl transferase [Serratia proteamaculans]RYM51179.1 glycosyl transferase [Serratia proteamaculans]CAI1163100.1 Chondroitin polymerase [Serratia proteamaculans]